MSFAPHMNSANMQGKPVIRGFFREKEYGQPFEFADRQNYPADFAPDFPYMIYVGESETRLAKVLKTVVYVVVDEDDNGAPVVQKWDIKNHKEYAV